MARNDVCVLLILNKTFELQSEIRLAGDDFDGDEVVPACVNVLSASFRFRRSEGLLDGVYLMRTRVGTGDTYRNDLAVVTQNLDKGTAELNNRLKKRISGAGEPDSILAIMKRLDALRAGSLQP